MINGFESHTCQLDNYEKNTLLPLLVKCLSGRIGRENAISNSRICNALYVSGYQTGEARLRKLINHIRVNNLIPCLMATSVGYYVTQDADEMRKYIGSLKGREDAIAEVRRAMEEQLKGM